MDCAGSAAAAGEKGGQGGMGASRTGSEGGEGFSIQLQACAHCVAVAGAPCPCQKRTNACTLMFPSRVPL